MHQGKVASIKLNLNKLVERYCAGGVTSRLLFSASDEEYSSIKRQLYKEPEFVEKFSEKFLDKKIRELVRSVAAGPHGLDQELADFIELLETYDTEYSIFLPLSGIEVQAHDQEFQLGNVCVVKSTPELRDEVKQVLRDILKQNPFYSDPQKDEFFSMTSLIVDRCFESPAMAKYSVVAEPIRAKERAEEETRRVIEVLRFYGMITCEPHWNVKVCLTHESSQRFRYIVCYSNEMFTPSASVSGPETNLVLSNDFIEQMKKSGANKLLELISKVELTDFEKKLLLAMHWLATSQMQYDNESKFLNLVSSLESLLTRDASYPIAISVAEGTAILLHDDLSERIRIRDSIKASYGTRSELSHGGSKAVPDFTLERLQRYAVSLLLALLKRTHEFKSQADLFEWLDIQKLRGLPPNNSLKPTA